MNCKEFTSIIRDYARLEWLSGSVREEAAKHVAGCPSCWERLTLELAYESKRAALARQRKAVQASRRVESEVMAAYRRRGKPETSDLPWFLREWFLGPALVTIAAVGSFMVPLEPKPTAVPQKAATSQKPVSTPEAANVDTLAGQTGARQTQDVQTAVAPSSVPLPEVSNAVPTPDDNVVHAAAGRGRAVPDRAPRAFRTAARSATVSSATASNATASSATVSSATVSSAIEPGATTKSVAARSTAESPIERVTEFVPLRYGKPVEPGELLQVVRIPLDRRELMRMGIPIPPDSVLVGVKADVIVGEDGMAKAIRLVY